MLSVRTRLVLIAAAITAFSTPGEAHAGKYDLDLTRLGSDGQGNITKDDSEFRSLSSELGSVVALQPMDPADSLGLSGFAVSADVSLNTISGSEDYWAEPTGGTADGVVPTVQLVGRKGLWPGLEIGGGATHVFDSSMWAMGGYGKLALHEGFHHLPIPSIALRGSFSRLLGAKDFNMTTASAGVSISHVFGVGKTFSLTPYLGYEALFVLSRSQVLDSTPACDEFPDNFNQDQCSGDGGSTEFVYKNSGAILRHRPYVGMRMVFSVIRLGFEAMIVPAGSSTGDVDGQTVSDQSGLQQQYTFSAGLDF
ncbi:MAG: hypothetical protein AAGA54_25260 [Myxococcota bacterium]